VDILLCDQNCDAALYGPVMTDLKQKMGVERNWYFAESTIPKTYITYGNGEPLYNMSDVVASLQELGVIAGGSGPKTAAAPAAAAP